MAFRNRGTYGKNMCIFDTSTVYKDISDKLNQAMRTAIEENGLQISPYGSYGQFDLIAVKAVYNMKNEYPDIVVVLLV